MDATTSIVYDEQHGPEKPTTLTIISTERRYDRYDKQPVWGRQAAREGKRKVVYAEAAETVLISADVTSSSSGA
jgi:hypothetical protein